jgi:23S rRNA pseudouridine1911/1915/1917 synthase
VPESLAGNRLDQIAAKLFPEYSRARLQSLIKEGKLLVNGKESRAKDRLILGDQIAVTVEPQKPLDHQAEPIPLNIVYEDDAVLIINKDAGSVVHPAAGNRSGTILNGLLHLIPDLKTIPRAGIVHRLDKDTTGIMVVAKTSGSYASLVNQLTQRTIKREYEAVVVGVLTGGGVVNAPIGRHPVHRKKQAVNEAGKEAITHYRIISRYRSHTHVQLNLETGRTHQIRVHMAHINHRLVGDPLYGGRLQMPVASSPGLTNILQNFKRQALHAKSLTFMHPETGRQVSWEVETTTDMRELLVALRSDYEKED